MDIPPNCESLHKINIDSIEDSYIESSEIAPGVYTSKTVVNGKYPIIKIINTTQNNVKFINKFEAIPLNHFHILNTKLVNENRNEMLKSVFEKTSSGEIPNELFELCYKFNKIFMLEDDSQ